MYRESCNPKPCPSIDVNKTRCPFTKVRHHVDLLGARIQKPLASGAWVKQQLAAQSDQAACLLVLRGLSLKLAMHMEELRSSRSLIQYSHDASPHIFAVSGSLKSVG